MRFTNTSKTSRGADLDHLEEMRKLNNTQITKQLNNLYRQSQNDDLERLRHALVEANKRGDMNEVYRLERILSSIRR